MYSVCCLLLPERVWRALNISSLLVNNCVVFLAAWLLPAPYWMLHTDAAAVCTEASDICKLSVRLNDLDRMVA